jgi:short-subunit dehydrogenase
VAEALGRQGVRLVLVSRHADKLEQAQRRLAQRNVQALYVVGDISDQASREEMVEQTLRDLGGLHLFVNCVGRENLSAYESQRPQAVEDMIQVNLVAPMLMSQQVLRPMLAAGEGHIVHLTSLAGSFPFAHQEVYGASKAGLINFTHSLRASYHARGVSGSVICPGITGTGLSARLVARATAGVPRRFVSPRRVAAAVIHAIQYDEPEVRVSTIPVWPLLVAQAVSPRFAAFTAERLGLNRMFRSIAECPGNVSSIASTSGVGHAAVRSQVR